MEDEPSIAELLLELADAHEVRAIATDSEFDRGAADAFDRAARIVSKEGVKGTEEIRDEYVDALGHASAGDELGGDE